jgi:peptidoglycan-associated lipoprotein
MILWGVALALPSACSHEQPPVAKRPPAAAAEAPAAAPAPPPPATAAVDDKATSAADLPADGPPAIFFEFDSALLKEDARDALAKIADDAKQRGKSQLVIEGNCDDLGTIEYNLALGQHRAEAAKQFLVHMGVPRSRIKTASYGSQRPRYPGHDDDSRAKNRRDDFIFREKTSKR